jgi:hypothetical protein
MVDELTDSIVESTGVLNLASGEINHVQYKHHPLDSQGLPAQQSDYEFTCGTLSNGERDVEFRIEVDVMSGKYAVTPSELLELKGRAAKLFSKTS